MRTSLPRNPVSRSEAGMAASGSGLRVASVNRRGSLRAAWKACTCETASPAALVEATGAAAVPGGHGGDVDRGCGDGDDELSDTDPDQDENDVGERGADGVADHAGGRPDAAPVVQRVERPVELLPHRYVEDLVEGEHAEQEPGDRGHDPSRPQ